jgi:hypothetical protein
MEQITLVHHVQSLWHHGLEPLLKGIVQRTESLFVVVGVEGVEIHCVEDDITLLGQVVLLGVVGVIGEREAGQIEMVHVEVASNDPVVEGVFICEVGIVQVTVIEDKWIFFIRSMVLYNEVLTRLLHNRGQHEH